MSNKGFNIEQLFLIFSKKLDAAIKKSGFNLSKYLVDHVCFRVQTEDQYQEYKGKFNLLGELLIESLVGGRAISTFKLHKPLIWKDKVIELIELPAPKKNSKYALGFEHAEFVIAEDFEDFAEKYPELEFDWRGCKKEINPELRFTWSQNMSIKFHHQSLESVIKIERKTELK